MKTTSVFKFGVEPKEIDNLAEMVASGTKTATSSLLEYYAAGKKTFSRLGEYISIQNSDNKEIAIVRIIKMEIVKFKDISETFAMEEGDGNLQNWTQIHRPYYSKLLSDIGSTLTDDTELVCEWFALVKK